MQNLAFHAESIFFALFDSQLNTMQLQVVNKQYTDCKAKFNLFFSRSSRGQKFRSNFESKKIKSHIKFKFIGSRH